MFGNGLLFAAFVLRVLLLLISNCHGEFHGITSDRAYSSLKAWQVAAAFSKPTFGSSLEVDELHQGKKITQLMREWLGTNNRATEACRRGEVVVNDLKVYSNYVLKSGDMVTFYLKGTEGVNNTTVADLNITHNSTSETESDIAYQKLVDRLCKFTNILLHPEQNPPLSVLYEDDDLAVVFKPSGVHALAWLGTLKKNTFALDDALPLVLAPPSPSLSQYLQSLQRPLPCHRLDARVAGCLLVGKTVSALSLLNQQFQNRDIEKEYTAILAGNATRALGHQASGTVEIAVNGLPATSHIFVEEVVPCNVYGSMSRVRLHPHTGRRHQLRQHCAYLTCPIIGDDEYHNTASYPDESQRKLMICRAEKGERVELCIDREDLFPAVRERGGLFLMSTGISFTHPSTGLRMRMECQVTKKFENIMFRAKKGAEWMVSQQKVEDVTHGI